MVLDQFIEKASILLMPQHAIDPNKLHINFLSKIPKCAFYISVIRNPVPNPAGNRNAFQRKNKKHAIPQRIIGIRWFIGVRWKIGRLEKCSQCAGQIDRERMQERRNRSRRPNSSGRRGGPRDPLPKGD
ncbi:hypothetical protein GWI33_017628 [Rhynchophorus ferrugineus]|uniref:Uncharacterized protein n=1 Tax=Rhynchophorus ferrugineus TaxID=354439 RepID=A0A834I1L9_RHYFE|nr:hypothetical protein GWI33_017628 [Rhynchophorus ferrugineus]